MKAYDCFHNKHAFLKVKIGKQVWMAKNLDIDDGGKGIFHNEENGEVYYTWDAAKRIADSIPGWHLPTREEWQELVDFCGSDKAGKLLKSKTGWTGKGKGTNKYGFSVPPGGYWFIGFNNVGSYAYFWTSTQYNDSYVYCQCLDSGTSVTESDYSKSRGYSVRLVQDSTK